MAASEKATGTRARIDRAEVSMYVRGAAVSEPDNVYAEKVLKKCTKTRDIQISPAVILLNMPWHLQKTAHYVKE